MAKQALVTVVVLTSRLENIVMGRGLFLKNIMKNEKVKGAILVVSILVNYVVLNFKKSIKSMRRQLLSNFGIWETRYQMLTRSLGRVLEDVGNKESYNELLKTTEFIRIFQTVPIE
ncbi:hypothetical protein KHA80_22650 [Anaerobacillus sp. HL2]|nr:hypothetical protein KHA80_22650 [Anaerobacillus sp. HL2]